MYYLMINNSCTKFYENWFITTGMPRQESKKHDGALLGSYLYAE